MLQVKNIEYIGDGSGAHLSFCKRSMTGFKVCAFFFRCMVLLRDIIMQVRIGIVFVYKYTCKIY